MRLLCFFGKKTIDKTFQLQEAGNRKHDKNKNRIERQPLKQHYTKTLELQGKQCFCSLAETRTTNTTQPTKTKQNRINKTSKGTKKEQEKNKEGVGSGEVAFQVALTWP